MQQEQTAAPQTEQISVETQKISSVGELLKKSFAIYRQGIRKFVGMIFIAPLLGSLPLIAVLVMLTTLKLISDSIRSDLFVIQVILGVLALVGVIILIYVWIVAQIGVYLLLKNFSPEIKVKEIFAQARKYFWPYIIVSLVTTVFVFLWSLLFIIPGLIFAIYYSFALWALIFEDYESTSALKRSKELVGGYWWAVMGRGLALGLIFFIVFLILSIPLFFIEENSIFTQVWNVILQIIQIIITPIFIIYYYFIYKDLVGIKGESKVERKKGGFNPLGEGKMEEK